LLEYRQFILPLHPNFCSKATLKRFIDYYSTNWHRQFSSQPEMKPTFYYSLWMQCEDRNRHSTYPYMSWSFWGGYAYLFLSWRARHIGTPRTVILMIFSDCRTGFWFELMRGIEVSNRITFRIGVSSYVFNYYLN